MRKVTLIASLLALGACLTLTWGDTQVSYVQWAGHYRVCDRRPAITSDELPYISFIPAFSGATIQKLEDNLPITSKAQLEAIKGIGPIKADILLALYNLEGAEQPTMRPACETGQYCPPMAPEQRELFIAEVTRVVDGDTIDVKLADGTEVRVRYIGMDTPEVHGKVECYSLEASAYNDRLVGGKAVWLEKDVQELDYYGRLLAYVYLDSDGQAMVNAILLSQGYAQIMSIPPNVKYADRFLKLQQEAREAGRGLWGACP